MSRPFHVKVLNRTRRWTDRAYSLFETRASLGPTRERLDYDERLALREIGWALREPGAVVYDVGAALGTYTSAAAKLRTVDLVVAFEPLSA